ncbi:MAG TPA: peptidylprolyl isomerase [Candidatus Baltobacteraceae bacterium]|jgi:hypothetical protein|nr:peptidylprolyl isomerase [Candidatus Baltobacteraceae bacterium]
MIGTIRRHQKWLWVLIIAATIISFTTYLSPTRQFGAGGQGSSSADLGLINGQPVTPEQYTAAEREALLFFRLRYGAWPTTEEQKKAADRWAEQRLLLDSELKQYNINVTPEAAARYTRQILGLRPDQAMPLDKFQDFVVNELGRKGGLTLDDFNRFVVHQAGQEYLVALFGMSGKLITAQEAEFFYRRENAPMVTEMVSFPATNYYAMTAPTPKELEDFYDKHQADYRLPDRIQVNYIAFAATNFLTRADKVLSTNIDDRADQVYHQEGPDAFKDETGKQLTPEEAEARIKKEIRLYAALTEARKDANAFLNDLSANHDDDHPFTRDDLQQLAKGRGLIVRTTEPFDEKDGSKDIDVPAKSLHVLFSLRGDDPDDKERALLYAPSPLLGENVVYVVGLQQRYPSEIQSLSQVRDEVVRDYRQIKSMDLATAAGEKFASTVQAGLTQGQSFDSVCAGDNIRPETLPPFSLNTPSIPSVTNRTEFTKLQETAFNLLTGQASKFTPTDDGGYVVYVRQRLGVDETKLRDELPAFLAKMREQRQVAAFEQWFGREMQLHLVPPASERNQPTG